MRAIDRQNEQNQGETQEEETVPEKHGRGETKAVSPPEKDA